MFQTTGRVSFVDFEGLLVRRKRGMTAKHSEWAIAPSVSEYDIQGPGTCREGS